MATVNKDFRVKAGLVVEGTTATVGGNTILAETAGDDYILGLVGGVAYITSVDGTQLSVVEGALSVNAEVFDDFGSAATAEANANDYTDELVGDATVTGTAGNTVTDRIATALSSAQSYADTAEADAISSANGYTDGRETAITTAYQSYADTAEADAISSSNTYTDGRETAITTAYQSYADTAESDAISSSNTYTDGRETAITTAYQAYADQAEVDAKAYTDTRETAITTAYEAYADQAEVDAKAYTDTEIAALVDSAPALLDTLNELAAAIGDDANFASTIATSVGEKVAKAGDTMTGLLVLSADPSANLGAATKQYVDAAESDAVTSANSYTDGRETAITTAYQSYADTAESDAVTTANGYADGVAADILDGTSVFSAITLTDALVGSASATAATSGTTVDTFSATTYTAAKYIIQMKKGTDIELIEMLVAVDGSNNVYVTEYANVQSNGELGTTNAVYAGGNVLLQVTAAAADTSVKVSKTYIEA